MDDALPPRCGMAPAFSGDRAGPAADEQNEVGLVEYCAGFVRAAVRSDHAESQRMAVEDRALAADRGGDRSEEHTSELQSLMRISYAVFCLKKNIIIETNSN